MLLQVSSVLFLVLERAAEIFVFSVDYCTWRNRRIDSWTHEFLCPGCGGYVLWRLRIRMCAVNLLKLLIFAEVYELPKILCLFLVYKLR